MRVLHLISGGDTGGAKTHVLSLLSELSKSISVKLVCFMDGPFLSEAKALGLDVLLLAQSGRGDLSVLRTITGLVREGGYDIVHTHGARANFLVAIAKRGLGVPCLTTVHSDYRLDFAGNAYKNLIYTTLNSLALRRFDYYVAVSESFRTMLLQRHFAPERVFTVYNGIDFATPIDVPPRAEVLAAHGLTIAPDAPLIGIVGRLAAVKDQATFIRAVPLVLRQRADAHFLLVGDGEERAALERLAASLGVAERVHFLGFHANPHPLLGNFDVNVLTSLSESFPYVLLEGARLKRATVATAVGGVSDLISDDDHGLLFPVGDHAALARALLTLLADPDRRRRCGEAIQERARQRFSLTRMAEQQLDIYRQITERSC